MPGSIPWNIKCGCLCPAVVPSSRIGHWMTGKRSGAPRGAAARHLQESDKFWASPAFLLGVEDVAVGWAVFGLGAPVLGSVPVVSPIPPRPLPDIFSQAVAGDWTVLPPLCSLLCLWEIFVHQEWTREKTWGMIWALACVKVQVLSWASLSPTKANPDLCWRPVFVFPYVWLGCVKAGDAFTSFRNQLQTVKRNSTWSSSYSFFWPLF